MTKWMLVAALLLFVPLAAGAQNNYVEVRFHCPVGPLLELNWKNDPKGSYYEAGKTHDITFKGGTPPHYASGYWERTIARYGKTLTCSYKHVTPLRTTYDYTVNRDIISCSLSGTTAVCKLKP